MILSRRLFSRQVRVGILHMASQAGTRMANVNKRHASHCESIVVTRMHWQLPVTVGKLRVYCRFNLKFEPTDLRFRAWVAKLFGMLPFSKLLASRRYCSVLMAANDDGIVPTSPFEPRSRFTSHDKPDTPLGIVPCRLYELNTTNLPSGQQSRSQLET